MRHTILQTVVSIGVLLVFFLSSAAIYNNDEGEDREPTRHIIKIIHMKFVPDKLVVKKGDTVVWENKDFFPHDVTDEDNTWGSSPFGNDEEWSKVITKDEKYFCNLHKVMKGTIQME